ncbi:MAG: sigma-70 family RNA polymerase sigma factor [Planctomycetota bacterium]|nr:sigma-70 family RNA polymerase sigma factor [Planctomycetota bacterium]
MTSSDDVIQQVLAQRGDLLGYLGSLTRRKDLAEEAFQETMMRLVAQRGTFMPGLNAIAWARGIGRNVVRELQRRQHQGPLVNSELLALVEGAWEDEEPEESFADDLPHLQDCLGKLPARQRQLVQLRYHDGLSMREIASQTQGNEGSIQTALSRLRQVLESCIRRLRAQGEMQ